MSVLQADLVYVSSAVFFKLLQDEFVQTKSFQTDGVEILTNHERWLVAPWASWDPLQEGQPVLLGTLLSTFAVLKGLRLVCLISSDALKQQVYLPVGFDPARDLFELLKEEFPKLLVDRFWDNIWVIEKESFLQGVS